MKMLKDEQQAWTIKKEQQQKTPVFYLLEGLGWLALNFFFHHHP